MRALMRNREFILSGLNLKIEDRNEPISRVYDKFELCKLLKLAKIFQ